jgi:hypothetical protein
MFALAYLHRLWISSLQTATCARDVALLGPNSSGSRRSIPASIHLADYCNGFHLSSGASRIAKTVEQVRNRKSS